MDPHSWNMHLGPIPPVDPTDLRKIRGYMLENQREKTTGIAVFESICNPGANVFAVWYRASVLQRCEDLGLLSSWIEHGSLNDAAVNVAAEFPMEKMEAGIIHKSLPLDVQAFLKRIDTESKEAKP